MKFSLFYEMQILQPTRATEHALFHQCLEQALLAEKLGYHCIWAVEHHGLHEYAHSSAPEIFLSFVAAHTSRIRIGQGCALLPGRYNHPIRVAERAATLDILSKGRLNLGTARSVSRIEQDAFEVDRDTLRDQWREAIEMIPRMWQSEPFSHSGRFYDIAPINVIPKPVQTPHPPMFGACANPAQAALIGSMGMGVLCLAMHTDEDLAKYVRQYRNAVDNATPVGFGKTNHFSCNPATLVLEDDDEACRHGLRAAGYFIAAMDHYSGAERPVGGPQVSMAFPSESSIEGFKRIRNTSRQQLSSIIGNPAAAREAVQRFVDADVDELILVMQTGTTSHEMTMESIRTFGEQVIPFFN